MEALELATRQQKCVSQLELTLIFILLVSMANKPALICKLLRLFTEPTLFGVHTNEPLSHLLHGGTRFFVTIV